MYYAAIAAGLVLGYFILHWFFPYFIEGRRARLTARSFLSVALILIATIIGVIVSVSMKDLDLGNRILHAFNGGFVTFMACFLAARDSKTSMTKFQFWVLAGLIVTALGVANELVEFFMQHYGIAVFMRASDDTWLDLLSNTVGILIASACFVPFSGKRPSPPQL